MKELIVITPEALKEIVSYVVSKEIDSIKEILTTQSNGLDKEWLTRKEKAKKENISISMVDKLVRLGKFEKKKIGRKTLIKS